MTVCIIRQSLFFLYFSFGYMDIFNEEEMAGGQNSEQAQELIQLTSEDILTLLCLDLMFNNVSVLL